ncbi:MAG: response regulator transcription factor [Bacteroidota bacterium]|jgi:DNA-binding NarL/FixJ family response regulator|nr:response regulator transcription factor [Bacteroidota bacterium]
MLSICIATTFPVFLDGLLRVLHQQHDMDVCAPTMDAASLIRSCRLHHADVLVLDVKFSGDRTESLLRRLRQSGCVAAVVLFGEWTPETADRADRMGVCGLVSAEDSADTFLRAIRATAAGSRFVSDRVQRMFDTTRDEATRDEDRLERLLTPTERQVLYALADNRTSRQIADEMFISFRTVQKHRSNIVRKLHLDGSNALLSLAVRHFRDMR